MKTVIRVCLALMFAAGVSIGLGACNTMRGAGQDLENAGNEVKKEAHDVGTDSSRDYD